MTIAFMRFQLLHLRFRISLGDEYAQPGQVYPLASASSTGSVRPAAASKAVAVILVPTTTVRPGSGRHQVAHAALWRCYDAWSWRSTRV